MSVPESLRRAPYRFVNIADAVVMPPKAVRDAIEKRDAHGKPDPNLLCEPLDAGYCGEIEVEWAAETPILVGAKREDGVDGPMRPGDGDNDDFWIPGSTFRGLARAACEIVGHARLDPINRKHVFALRDFEHPDYNSESGLKLGDARVVKAGWLWWDKSSETASIEPCPLGYVEIADLLPSLDQSRDIDGWIVGGLGTKYQAAGMYDAKARAINFNKRTMFSTLPRDAQGRVRVVPSKSGGLPGVFVFSGAVPRRREGQGPQRGRKRWEYAFLAPPRASERVVLNRESFERFELVHTAPGASKREPVGSWQLLKPQFERGEPVAVFYLGDLRTQPANSFAFGLTRLFRVPHRFGLRAVAERLASHRLVEKSGTNFHPDMVAALFGHVIEPGDVGRAAKDDTTDLALKGRVAFFGARIQRSKTQEPVESPPTATIAMAPRASFAPFYLQGSTKDWSADDARLAGRKRYLPRVPAPASPSTALLDSLRDRLRTQIAVLPPQVQAKETTQSRVSFLYDKRGGELRFASRIRLHNVLAEEIGLLVSALTHGGDAAKPYRHMIGRARGHGAGQTRVVALRMTLEVNTIAGKNNLSAPTPDETREGAREGFIDRAYSADEWQAANVSLNPFLDAFIAHMRDPENSVGADKAALAQFPAVRSVQEFLDVSDPREGAKLKDAETGGAYLSLSDHARLKKLTQKHRGAARAKEPDPPRLLPSG